ncbi:origin recognition complex, subunit 6 [Pyrenochaeta sp. MPI-SDFR-AT-0127]|nr:origin recognition complex, subunit 6 [Pyrenochaeta sp. MPI-SDFR-AT-0127]
MSRANIEQSLTGLIPTLNGPLPPELLELALSLLARSRSVAHLKPDEEIARPYACAQLACERLKKRLNLPTIASRPPCPPRIYKKLYNYLSSALPTSTATRDPQTPRKTTTSVPPSAHNTPKTPLSGRKTPRSTRMGDERTQETPEWAMSTIRELVKAFEYPIAAPHIYTGVESILPLLLRMSAAAADSPSQRPRRATTTSQGSLTKVTDTRILSLIAVIFLYVFTRMKDVDVSPEQYNEWREKAVTTLLKLSAARDATYEELSLQTEQMMPMAQEEGWLQMEWFLNVTPHNDGSEMDGVETTGSDSHFAAVKHKGLKIGGSDYIGLGTMMQDATDYLGERKQEDYKNWKAKIMVRVQELETNSKIDPA